MIDEIDGHDPQQVSDAITQARMESGRPSIICCKTLIGWGSPNKQATAAAHGAPLGEDEVALAREQMGWTHPAFEVPQVVYQAFDCTEQGARSESDWNAQFDIYAKTYPELAAEFRRRVDGQLPDDWAAVSEKAIAGADSKAVATRQSSKIALDGFGPILPELIGGSADLTGSNLTLWDGSTVLSPDNPEGNYVYFGVREFGMAAIVNGLALHGGFIPYGATFLMFSEYARNAIRMAALMRIQSIMVLTHDSIGLGEDGPTHQAVEQAATLRLMPNLSVWRPCDTQETLVAWAAAIARKNGPTCLLFSRQGVAQQPREPAQVEQIRKGGYVLLDCPDEPEALIIATGTEVQLAVDAAQSLAEQGRQIRVVSMPSTDVFDAQTDTYRDSVLPPNVSARVVVEAGVTALWAKYAGAEGRILGVDDFGESAPAKEVYQLFNLNAGAVEQAVLDLLH